MTRAAIRSSSRRWAAGRVFRTNFFKTFEKQANGWIKEAGASRERRAIVAASVALELAHLLRDDPPDWAGQYLLWASLAMRQSSARTPNEEERLWHLACVAGMEELDQPWVLTAGDESPSSTFAPLGRAIGKGGELAIATRRFPDEPRFRLARAAFLESTLTRFDLTPDYLESRASARGQNASRRLGVEEPSHGSSESGMAGPRLSVEAAGRSGRI